MTRTLKALATVATLCVLSAPAWAQDGDETTDFAETNAEGQTVKYKARTEIDFEGVDVTGELVKPEGQLLLDRRQANFNPLIQVRRDFNAEMKASIDEVK